MYVSPLSHHLEKIPGYLMTVRLGTITNAAKAMAISQAALSQSLRVLEEGLGVELLVRSKSGVKPTAAGQVLFEHGIQLLEQTQHAEAQIKNPKVANTERLRVGTHEALAIHAWPAIVESFQESHPHVRLSIVSGRVDALRSQVLQGELECMVTVQPNKSPGLTSKTLYREAFQFYRTTLKGTKLSHSESLPKVLDRESLSNIPILTDSQAHLAEGKPVAQVLLKNGIYNLQHFQLNSFQASAKLAEKGLGLAFLPKRIGDSFLNLKEQKIAGFRESLFNHALCCSFKVGSKKKSLGALMAQIKRQMTQPQ